MIEELTTVIVLEQLRELHVAFPSHAGMKSNPSGTAEVYRRGMHGLSAEALRFAVGVAIDTGKYFPKVAELRDAAWNWTQRNRARFEFVDAEPLYCPRCTRRADWCERWRPALDLDGFTIYSEDGQYVQLERYERLLCPCASPCLFAPEPEFDGPWMAAHRIKWYFGRKRTHRNGLRKPVRFATLDELVPRVTEDE